MKDFTRKARLFLKALSFVILIFFFIPAGVIYLTRTRYNKSSVEAIPNILWHNPQRELCMISGAKIRCPFGENESVICKIHCSWGKYPPNIEAYMFTAASMHKFPLKKDPNVIWAFIHEESPRMNPMFMSDKLLSLFNYSATFSRHSDVPFPLLHFQSYSKFNLKESVTSLNIEDLTSTEYFVNTKMKNFYLNEIAPVLYIESNELTFIDRKDYVLKLMEYISIDSYGKSIRNRNLSEELDDGPPFLHYTARYKFAIAIENSICDDYITEKLWRPIEQGVVPIYFGSPTVRDWLPNEKSAILIEDFATPKLLAEFLKEILKNDTKYEEYIEHKTKGLITNQRLINEFNTRPYQTWRLRNYHALQCFLCAKLHENLTNKVNIVSRKALNCKMPSSIFTGAKDPSNKYNAVIEDWKKEMDDVYNKYLKGIPLERTNKAANFSYIPPIKLVRLLNTLNETRK